MIPKVKVKVKSLSCVRLFASPWTVAYQAPLSMGYSRQEYWNGLPFPPPGDLPDPGIKFASLVSPTLQVDSLPTEPWHLYSTCRGTLKHITQLYHSVP